MEQATRQFAERLTRLCNNIKCKGTGYHPLNIISGEIDKEIIELKQLAGHLSSAEFQSKVVARIQDLEAAEGTIPELCQSDKGYILKIGLTPLSMYDKDLWAMPFPQLFPYRGGVFGIARQTPLRFREWASMLLLRTELVSDVVHSSISNVWRDHMPDIAGFTSCP